MSVVSLPLRLIRCLFVCFCVGVSVLCNDVVVALICCVACVCVVLSRVVGFAVLL